MALSAPPKSLSSFGETPKAASSSVSVKGSKRKLVITELQRVGKALQPTGITFEFARENFTAPRGPQMFGLELRTHREDLPGSEEPVEQVLGWNYTAFTVKGVWDDRHAGAGYAEQTRKDFEALVKRGNPVRYQFEQLSITGLITKFEFLYVRKDYQTYNFTISPHVRYEGETIRTNINPQNRITTDPKTAVKKARDGLELMKADQDLASIRALSQVQSVLKSSIFSDINANLDTIESHITNAEHLVDTELLGPVANAAKALNRGVQIMASAKTAAAALLNKQKQIQASIHMSVDSLVSNFQFEGWHRTLAGDTREFIVQADQTQRDFKNRSQPKARRLHRVRQGESLYQISTRYYGTPFHWRDILLANHLSSIVLTGGELLIIPDLKL